MFSTPCFVTAATSATSCELGRGARDGAPAFCAHYVALLTEGEPRQLRDFLQQQMTPARPGGAAAAAAPRTQVGSQMMS